MRLSNGGDSTSLLECTSCEARYDFAEAILMFPDCNRAGRGRIGTNLVVRNDAKRLLLERQALIDEEDKLAERLSHFAAWGVTEDLSPDELSALVESDPYVFTQQLALRALWEAGHAAQLEQLAVSESQYARQAADGLKNPIGSETVPFFFDEELNPVVNIGL